MSERRAKVIPPKRHIFNRGWCMCTIWNKSFKRFRRLCSGNYTIPWVMYVCHLKEISEEVSETMLCKLNCTMGDVCVQFERNLSRGFRDYALVIKLYRGWCMCAVWKNSQAVSEMLCKLYCLKVILTQRCRWKKGYSDTSLACARVCARAHACVCAIWKESPKGSESPFLVSEICSRNDNADRQTDGRTDGRADDIAGR